MMLRMRHQPLRGTRVLDVTPMLRPERALFVELLESLDPEDWDTATECPAYSVKGVATHVLGDDLSLLSRQRDKATNIGAVRRAHQMRQHVQRAERDLPLVHRGLRMRHQRPVRGRNVTVRERFIPHRK